MDKETFLQRIKDIGSTEDSTDRISLLTSLSDEMSEVFESVNNLQGQITTLTENSNKDKEHIEKLQKANMDLFLRVGEQKSPDTNKGLTGDEPDNQKRKFEDLFKKGGNE